jgi:hypothetical protein
MIVEKLGTKIMRALKVTGKVDTEGKLSLSTLLF